MGWSGSRATSGDAQPPAPPRSMMNSRRRMCPRKTTLVQCLKPSTLRGQRMKNGHKRYQKLIRLNARFGSIFGSRFWRLQSPLFLHERTSLVRVRRSSQSDRVRRSSQSEGGRRKQYPSCSGRPRRVSPTGRANARPMINSAIPIISPCAQQDDGFSKGSTHPTGYAC